VVRHLPNFGQEEHALETGCVEEEVTDGLGSGAQAEPVIQGAVERLQFTNEADSNGPVAVCRFDLQRFDPNNKLPIPPPIPVEMRAPGSTGFDGSLNERDWVQVPGV